MRNCDTLPESGRSNTLTPRRNGNLQSVAQGNGGDHGKSTAGRDWLAAGAERGSHSQSPMAKPTDLHSAAINRVFLWHSYAAPICQMADPSHQEPKQPDVRHACLGWITWAYSLL